MKTWKDTAQQGSSEWLANRAKRYNASDLACAMGIDPNGRKRTELVQLYAIGLEREFSEWVQKNIIDPGHEIEALARPIIENRIDSALYAEVLVGEVDDLKLPLGASLDGITAGDDVTFECKRRNKALWASVSAGIVPEGNRPQCEQGLMLSGAEVCRFTVSDGTDEGTISCEYRSDPVLRAKIIPTWMQLEKDIDAYVHVEHAERPAAEVSITLPTLFIHAKGEIVGGNLDDYHAAWTAKLKEVREIVLVTDQDFSNAKAGATLLRDQIKKVRLTQDGMLDQTVSIGDAMRRLDDLAENFRVTALQLEKDVEREDATKKAVIVASAKADYADYVAALNARIGGNWMPDVKPDFVQAIKNKRTYASMHDSVNTMLANAKVDADEVANRIERNRKFLSLGEPNDWIFLFPDFSSVCAKPEDDFSALLNLRAGQHKEAENKKLEAERARIQAEERAKAEREAAVKIEAAKQEAVRQERERAEQEAKAKAEEDQRGKAALTYTCDDPDTSHLRQNGGGQQSVDADQREMPDTEAASTPPNTTREGEPAIPAGAGPEPAQPVVEPTEWAIYFCGYGGDLECEPAFMDEQWIYTKDRAMEEADKMNERALEHETPRPGNSRIYEARPAPAGYWKEMQTAIVAAQDAPAVPTKQVEDDAVIDHQQDIAEFLKAHDFKDEARVRAILVEFVKFLVLRAFKRKSA